MVMLCCILICHLKKKTDEKLELTFKNKETVYKITISFARTLTSTTISQEVMQLFNIIYRRNALKHLKLTQIGRNHFNLEKGIDIEQHNVKILPGFLATIYATSNGLFYNCDTIHKTLRTDTVLDMWNDYKRNADDPERSFGKDLSNIIVLCPYKKRTVHIDRVDFKRTPRSTFKRNGKDVTYVQYYMEVYKLKIKDLNQPMLVHRPKKHSDREEYYVPELCHFTGITDAMRNDQNVMRDIKQHTILGPNMRINEITKFVKGSARNPEFSKALSEWKFKLDERLLRVNGRVLPTQKILFGNNRTIEPNSSAQWDIRSTPLYKGVQIRNWCVLFPSRERDTVTGFLNDLFRVSNPIDVKFSKNFKMFELKNTTPSSYESMLESQVSNKKFEFVLVILQNNDKFCYGTVKEYLCKKMPIPSQCVVLRTIKSKGLLSKATKIAVQIASKTGGSPWALQTLVLPELTMVCGMDVYHSGEIVNRKKDSIVGFTATVNSKLTSYYSRILVNKPGRELVDELKPAFEEALTKFKATNKNYPKFIIFYRDGIGEGDINKSKDDDKKKKVKDDVLQNEVLSLEKSLKALKIDAKITFIVVLKRINTRLFSGTDNLSNPTPGTVVDTGIINKDCEEFFLVSQNVNQGSATPTRYQCIKNDANLNSKFLQSLTFQLCHMYYNWFGTVRVPSVCVYAHKVAFLAGQSVKGEDPTRSIADKLYYL